jgi:predicted phosphoribosyltransferase
MIEDRFEDRVHAGRVLGAAMRDLDVPRDAIVVGLPRGGVPVAAEVARALDLPLDLIIVRKLGLPMQPELAMGAIASGGARVLNEDVIRHLRDPDAALAEVTRIEREELERRERVLRAGRPPFRVAGRSVLLVDDGLATGATMAVAVQAVRELGATTVIAIAPVASVEARERVAAVADRTFFLAVPRHFSAVGQWYADFSPTSDREVIAALAGATRPVHRTC